MMRKSIGTVAVFLGLLAVLPAARAADDLLKLLPEKTLGFVRVNRLAETDAKLAEFSRRAQWPMPGLLALFKAQAGVKEGLDEKGAAALVVVGEDKYDQPPVVLFVPVTDYEKFLAPVKRGELKPGIARVQIWNSAFLARRVGSYAVFAEAQHEELLESGLAPGGLNLELGAVAAYLEENDLSAVITHHGIFFVARIVEQQVNRMKELLLRAGEESGSLTKAIDIYGRACKAIEDQTSALAAGLRLEKQGALRVSSRASLVPSGIAAATVAKIAPSKENLFMGLPGGPFVLAGGFALPLDLSGAMRGVCSDLVKAIAGPAGMSVEQAEQLVKNAFELFKSVRFHSFLLQPGKGEPVYRDTIAVTRVESAQTFLADYEKQMKTYGQLARKPLNKTAVGLPLAVEVHRTKINGMSALEIAMQMPTGGTANAARMFAKLMGPSGKVTVFIAAVDEHTVVTSYVNKELLVAAAEALTRPEKGLAADPLVAKTKAMLPGDALAVGYWSPSGTVAFANRLLKVFAPLPGVPKSVPEFPSTPPVGFAARTAPAQVQAEIVVPAEVIQSLMAYGMKLVATFQGAGQ